MLGSHFSAIFANFLRKNGVFLKNQCDDPVFTKKLALVYQQRQF
jgi:hypothetical protein